MELKIEVSIPNQAFYDVLTTAWEGGSDYWSSGYEATAHRLGGEGENSLDVVAIEFVAPRGADPECDPPVICAKVGPSEIGFALANVLNGQAKVAEHILKDIGSNLQDLGACDADTADVLLQVATFGEIVYG